MRRGFVFSVVGWIVLLIAFTLTSALARAIFEPEWRIPGGLALAAGAFLLVVRAGNHWQDSDTRKASHAEFMAQASPLSRRQILERAAHPLAELAEAEKRVTDRDGSTPRPPPRPEA